MSQAPAADPRAVVVSPSAIIDHAYSLTTAQVRSLLGPEALGGSSRVPFDTLLRLQQSLPQDASAGTVSPAGSAPNVARNLARQGARVRLVTGCGDDDAGRAFAQGMSEAGVDTSGIATTHGASTGQTLVLFHEGHRTMRTFISPDAMLKPTALTAQHFPGYPAQPASQPPSLGESGRDDVSRGAGAGWVFVSAYCCYSEGLIQRACELARQAGWRVFLDLASHEVVGSHSAALWSLVSSGAVDLCVCNEDEASALWQYSQTTTSSTTDNTTDSTTDSTAPTPPPLTAHTSTTTAAASTPLPHILTPAEQWAGQWLRQHCKVAGVVTLSSRGCAVFSDHVHSGVVHVQSAAVTEPVDSTGAGDALCGGFLYGLLHGWPLEACAYRGCLAGAAAVCVKGPDLTPEAWSSMHEQSMIHRDRHIT